MKKDTRLSLLFCTASNRKLVWAWERGFSDVVLAVYTVYNYYTLSTLSDLIPRLSLSQASLLAVRVWE